jgi:long-chain acyl-CoA synthetase
VGKKYRWLTYEETQNRVINLGRGLVSLGLRPCQESHVGIYATNSPQWFIAELACYFNSMMVVPLYDTLGPAACLSIIKRGKQLLMQCSNTRRYKQMKLVLLNLIRSRRLWSSLHGLGWIGAISQVTLN